ncbi:MAG TPA: tRNA (guanine(46)-N(7))-methyltransferase TrmB [Rhizomicrobium sp.]|nr:tRNA (guanine(46)-N(7))-methyltransferase TrmB [Rhizomicrobium sp.]
MPGLSEKGANSAGGRRRKLYGRRKGPKLSAHQSALVETLVPELRLDIRGGADPKSWFGLPVDDVWLEIGFGAGEHLLWQVRQHRNVGIIGAEPYESGVAKLLSKLSALENRDDLLGRVRIHGGDAREIIDALPDASLGRVFLLFPDPWPKKRHHKRRFIQMEALDALARVMKPGAEFRFASDDACYVSWTLERVLAHSAFSWIAEKAGDWCLRPIDWPPTRYEEKALHGTPVFLRTQRLRAAPFR